MKHICDEFACPLTGTTFSFEISRTFTDMDRYLCYILPFLHDKVLVAQSCLTIWDPKDCSLPGSSAHGILQARMLKWITISFTRGSSQPRDQTPVSHIARGGGLFISWATREAQSGEQLQTQIIISTINVMLSNNPQTIPTYHSRSMEKLSSAKLVLSITKFGDHCYTA